MRDEDISQLPWMLLTDESTQDLDIEDAFGHERYVKSLEEQIKTAPRGHTMGLFGGYGTGKTWVVKRLINLLRDGDSDIGIVEYDA